MTTAFRPLLLLLLLLFLPAAVSAQALRVTDAYSFETPAPGVPAAGYLSLTNTGRKADRLLAVESPLAGRIEVHRMSMSGGLMRMRALPLPLAVPAGGTLSFAQGGVHLMLYEPKQPFVTGMRVPLTFVFEKVGRVGAEMLVRARPVEAETHDRHH